MAEDVAVGTKSIKERIIGATGSVSGIASILGSWQVCHNVCLGIIASLSLIGITLTGMPLEFLTKIAVPIWSVAVVLLGVSIFFYLKKLCISRNLIIFNSGLIIAGTPFQAVKSFSLIFWIIGGLISLTGVYLFLEDKFNKKKNKNIDYEMYILYGVVIIAIVGLIISFTGFDFNKKTVENKNNAVNNINNKAIPSALPTKSSDFKIISTGSTDQGDVAIDLTPNKVVNGKLEVDIAVNTHSVDLTQFDLKEITTLEYNGKVVKPITASGLSGHHASGTLVFNVGEEISKFVIKIKGIPQLEERIFDWR